eukprot:TRINITY_DN67781_c0_g1_i1.p1 TRINITY_DN67781_c0_g1~~TRINITY_DN67781_c0_g1_i1.p1  ORF type:complete len:119 (+),score=36.33 TRINITY_DN67781_c0_g1_i1:88-444(+)
MALKIAAAFALLASSAEAVVAKPVQSLISHDTNLGPFDSKEAACDYCGSSYTKVGDAPAGPIAEKCVCMSHPVDGGKFTMFCATPPSAAGYVAEKKGCTCKFRDMEAMGKTTCKDITA